MTVCRSTMTSVTSLFSTYHKNWTCEWLLQSLISVVNRKNCFKLDTYSLSLLNCNMWWKLCGIWIWLWNKQQSSWWKSLFSPQAKKPVRSRAISIILDLSLWYWWDIHKQSNHPGFHIPPSNWESYCAVLRKVSDNIMSRQGVQEYLGPSTP